MEDDTEEAIFQMIGQPPENVLHVTATTLVKDRKRNPRTLPTELYQLIGKTFIFQVRCGSQKQDNTRSDLTFTVVYDPKNIADRLQTETAIASSSKTAAHQSPSSVMLISTPSGPPYTPVSPPSSSLIAPSSATPAQAMGTTLIPEEPQAKRSLAFPLN